MNELAFIGLVALVLILVVAFITVNGLPIAT
jgi:hypothetical protein